MRLKRHLLSVCSMLLGSSAIFGSLYYMNEHGTLAPPVEKPDAVAFEVAPPPPRKPPKKDRTAPRRKPSQTVSPKLAPSPSLASAVGGLSFNLPGFEASDLGAVGSDLLESGASKSMVMTEDAVDKKPEPLRQAPPQFPDKARQRGIQGYVKLNLFINTTGSVEKVRVLEADPQGIFEESAIAAAEPWEFSPAEYNGNPVTGWFKRTVSFRLN